VRGGGGWKPVHGPTSKELVVRTEMDLLDGRFVLEGDQFVAELLGLALEFGFGPLLPLCLSGHPNGFVIFDLLANHSVKDHGYLVRCRRNRCTRAQLRFHPAQVVAQGRRAVMQGGSGEPE
jgi:hypothetical protein